MFKKISVIGAGNFGLALSYLFSKKSEEVVIYSRDKLVCEYINTNKYHPSRLNKKYLGANIKANYEICQVVKNSQIIILAVPMGVLKASILKMEKYFDPKVVLISAIKGIDPQSLELSCDIINNLVPQEISQRACYISGPSFAHELISGLPTGISIASINISQAEKISKFISSSHVKIYAAQDNIGICLGGALKNIVAIGAGICSGLGLGLNTQAMYITRAMGELILLGRAMGAKKETLLGLSGLGDIILSCSSKNSRNFLLGSYLSKSYSLAQACEKIGSVVEGVRSALAVPKICKKYNMKLAVFMSIYNILYENKLAQEEINKLF